MPSQSETELGTLGGRTFRDDELEPAGFESDYTAGSSGSWNRCLSNLAKYPTPHFNASSVVLLLGILLLATWVPELSYAKDDSVSTEALAPGAGAPKYVYLGAPAAGPQPEEVTAEHGAVAADDGRCSAIGRDVLRDGGSAVDAAIACAFCGGVVNPSSSGIGGGAFILIRAADGTSEVIDAREAAPAGASQDMYANQSEASVTGALAAAVPGEVAGLYLAWQRHGVLPWPRLVTPAADLAASFAVGRHLAHSIKSHLQVILDTPLLKETYAPEGAALAEGAECSNPRLERTLRQLAAAEAGGRALYEGALAEALAGDVQAAGGILTVDDLAAYAPILRDPVQKEVLGLTLLGVPPPSSGGLTIAAMLEFLSQYALPLVGSAGLAAHRTVEAMKHAFALRMALGDPAFVPEAAAVAADMLRKPFIAALVANTSDHTTFPASHYGGKWSQLNDHGTSHLSVVDESRMAVAMTTTVNTAFGSKVVSAATGVLLNNEMDDFSKPGEPNVYGLEPAEANYIRPGKRPLSSMSPTIVLQGGEVRMVTGASGGPRIITATLQTILGVVAYGRGVWDAVHSPRLHHQLLPHNVFSEHQDIEGSPSINMSAAIEEALISRNHTVKPTTFAGVCHAIVVDPESGTLTAVSDRRKGGRPAAY